MSFFYQHSRGNDARQMTCKRKTHLKKIRFWRRALTDKNFAEFFPGQILTRKSMKSIPYSFIFSFSFFLIPKKNLKTIIIISVKIEYLIQKKWTKLDLDHFRIEVNQLLKLFFYQTILNLWSASLSYILNE